MTSTNSSTKFFRMLKTVFCRNAVLATVFQILTAVFAFYISSPYLSRALFGEARETDTVFVADWMYLCYGHLCIAFGFLFAAVLFRELYGKRASDFLFSMPVKRSVYFNANVFFGLINFVISFSVSAGIVYAAYSSSESFDFAYFIKIMAVLLLCVSAVFLVFAFCAAASGKLWHYLLLAFIITVIITFGALSAAIYINNSVWGLRFKVGYAWSVAPFGLFYRGMTGRAQFLPARAILLFIQAAAAYAAGLAVFKRRKAETAEDRVSGKAVPAVFIIICILSEILFCLCLSEIGFSLRIAVAAAVSLVTAVVLSAVFYRKVLGKGAVCGLGTALLVSAVFIGTVEFVLPEKYSTVVPKPEEVKSAVVYSNGTSGITSIQKELYSSFSVDIPKILFDRPPSVYNLFEGNGEDTQYAYTFAQEDSKEKLFALHSRLASEELRKKACQKDHYENGYNSLKIEYELKNGKKITRFFSWGSDDAFSEYAALLKTEEGLNRIMPFNLKPENIFCASISLTYPQAYSCYGTEASPFHDMYLSDYTELLDAMKKDIAAMPAVEFLHNYAPNFAVALPETIYQQNVMTMSVYALNENTVTDEQRALFENMLLGEVLDCEQQYRGQSGFSGPLTDLCNIKVSKNDRATRTFIEDYLGFAFDEAVFDAWANADENTLPDTESSGR